MYINRKSNLYASPRNELHVGNETGESKVITCLTGIFILVLIACLSYGLISLLSH